MSSNSIQKMVEIFNSKNIGDKNIPSQKEKSNDNFSSKMPKKVNNKILDINKNIEKRASMPLKSNNNINNNKSKVNNNNENKEKEDIKIRNRGETVLSKLIKDHNPIISEKKISTESNSKKIINITSDLEFNESDKESMFRLEIEEDAFNFKEENFKKRRYNKENVEKCGKKFFRLRYVKNKIKENNQKAEKNKESNEDSQLNLDKERILRKYNSEFILIVEKSILSFNVKNFKDSYEILKNSGIIKNEREYGEFLLVVSGFDKFLMGEFLAKEKYPNNKKEVLNNFIESINMNNDKVTSFLDCLRFLFSRLNLPKDANLILEIMDKFSVNYFEVNKKDTSFVEIFHSSDKVYLLVSTILALNTMFTRTDIKIKNVIKKEEFIKMNVDISKEFIMKLYDDLKKNPISMTDDYNELMYKKLASLVGENDGNNTEEKSKKIPRNNSGDKINENWLIINKNLNEKLNKNLNNTESMNDVEENEDSNLDSLKEEDKLILKTPQKLYRIKGGKKLSQKEYFFSEDLTRIYYENNQKKWFDLSKLKEIYNGSDHSHNNEILKYLKSNPSEEPFKNNFISLIFESNQVDLMSDNLDSAMKWYKAIKNFISIYKKSNKDIKKDEELAKIENEIKDMTQSIWEAIYENYASFCNFLIIKLNERNFLPTSLQKSTNSSDNLKKLSYKNSINYLKLIESKLKKIKEVDDSDFIYLFHMGLPNLIRKDIWKTLIGNSCGILSSTYEQMLKKIPVFNFKNLDLSNSKDKVYSADNLSNLIIKEIIEVNDLFIKEEVNLKMDKIITMNKVYNIARSFWTLRPDIPFNKSLITIIYLLLFVFKEEDNTFCNVINLICSNIFQIFIGNNEEIKIYSIFFNELLEKYLPKIANQFKKLEITPELYMIPWFEELFTKTFSVNLLYHIFDLFLLNGEYILFSVGLSIIKVLEDEFLNLTINEIFKVLQRFNENFSELDFIEILNSFSNIKNDVSQWKSSNFISTQKINLALSISPNEAF